jgi:hypothetical protein
LFQGEVDLPHLDIQMLLNAEMWDDSDAKPDYLQCSGHERGCCLIQAWMRAQARHTCLPRQSRSFRKACYNLAGLR